MRKVTFSISFLRSSGILNFCTNYIHTDSGKPLKSQRKLFFPFNSVIQLSESHIEISTPTSMKNMNSRNLYFMFL